MKKKLILLAFVLLISTFKLPAQIASSAQNLKGEKGLHQNVLKTIKDNIKEKYFDPKLRGIDIEANARKASELIDDAKSAAEMDDIIARFLYPFDDSHLYYIPTSKTARVEYGWEMTFIGDKAFATRVEEESDAFKKGLRVGDQIYMVNDYILTRPEFSLFRYHFNILRPQASLNVLLIKPNGNKYKVDLKAKVTVDSVFVPNRRELILEAETQYAESTKQLFSDEIPGLAVWKMPNFELSPTKLGKMADRVKKSGALILDLRGNPGGYVAAMETLASHFFDKEVKLYLVQERDGLKQRILKPETKDVFKGKLVILIDSDSASASEAFSRIMQLEKRGTVLGDQSAGALMEGQVFYHTFGLDTRVPYGISVTVADVIMRDGQRLEKIGVTPDEKILPTAADLAAKRDPVMARAAEILGFKMTAEQAGAIFEKKK
jgi:C-terminal processing protease CtpA/Prc